MKKKAALNPFLPDFPAELGGGGFCAFKRTSMATRVSDGVSSMAGRARILDSWNRGSLAQRGAIQSLPYFQSVDRKDIEDWNSFVGRAAAETITYLTAFKQRFEAEEDVYINLTWVCESEFQNLKP